MEGAIIVAVNMMYVLKLSDESFQKNPGKEISYALCLKTCLAEPDTWMEPDVKAIGLKYYEYISIHVDDSMTISNEHDNIIKGVEETYTLGGLKGLFDENPKYLG